MISQIQTIPEIVNILKILFTGFLAFAIAFFVTPIMTHFLYRYKIGVKIKECSVSGEKLTFISSLHRDKSGTPIMGGILVWFTVTVLAFASHYLFPIISQWIGVNFIARLDFLSRKQVWLPLAALVSTGILGMLDDIMSCRGWGSNKGGGMRFIYRFGWLILLSLLGAVWFYNKLGWNSVHIPAIGDFTIGWWYIPLFMFIIIFSAISSNETDGLDGLNGGVLLIAFSVFAAIAFFHNKIDMASFCAAIAGALLAFLWYNIYPARFFMGDTGALSLGTTLGVVAMMTNSALVLFIVVFIYVIESGSAAIQLTSKKFFKRKVFLAAPIHHHFEAKGWPETKVTMRAWIFTFVTALVGLIVGILGAGKIR